MPAHRGGCWRPPIPPSRPPPWARAIVTVRSGEELGGCLVGFHTQASIDPWRHAVLLSRANHTHWVWRAGATHLAVHLLGPDDHDLAALFGAETDDGDAHKFERVPWSPSPQGSPILQNVPGWFAGPVVGSQTMGDDDLVLIQPETGSLDLGPGMALLRFHDVADLPPGHPAHTA